ncbi:MAG: ChbG/HpnK family deacetylase [Actinobacteria bacterium]|nr:MAG: ChbG/HpnK family deacetylase [Actinomycetota bacterium]
MRVLLAPGRGPHRAARLPRLPGQHEGPRAPSRCELPDGARPLRCPPQAAGTGQGASRIDPAPGRRAGGLGRRGHRRRRGHAPARLSADARRAGSVRHRVPSATVSTLAERLGYGASDKLVIVNCDDLGATYGANVGVYEALRAGMATSASLMVPCPWARDAAARYRGEDVGVHLTLNAEFDLYRWGPITHAPSLLDGDGGFPRTVEDVWDHADLDEVRRECRAQVERAIYWGFDVSHLDSHMGTMQLRPEFFDVYLELAVDFRLPLRLSGASTERVIGFPFRRLAAEEGVVFPDQFVYVPGVGSRRVLERALFDLRPGITELYVHPASDSPELRALAPDWAARVDDHDAVTRDKALLTLAERAGVIFIGWRQLRDLMRT